jgi:hypothetical protein
MEEGKSFLRFVYPLKDCYTIDKDVPENAIAFKEKWIQNRISEEGFFGFDHRFAQ